MKQSSEHARRLSRRQFLAASGGVTAVAILAACTGAPAAAPADAPADDTPSGEGEVITFLVRTDIRNAYAADAGVERWNAEFPERTIVMEEPSEGAVNTKIQAAQASGDLIWDGFAVIALPWDTATWVNQGLIQPLDPFIEASSIVGAEDVVSGIIPSVADSLKSDGQLYAIPGNVGSVALGWYNEFLDAAGVDRPFVTWDEVRAAAEQVQASNPDIVPFSRPNVPLTDLTAMIWGAADEVFTSDGLVDWQGEASIAAINWQQEMVSAGLMPGVVSEFGEWLQQGIAIMSSFDVHGTLAQQSFGDEAADTGINMRKDADDPKSGTPFWTNGCVVLDQSSNPQGITDFFLWWFSPENEEMGKQIADVAAKPAYDYTYESYVKDVDKHQWQVEGIELVRNSTAFQPTLLWNIEAPIVKTWVEKALDPNNNMSAEEAMAEAVAEINEEVEELL